MEFLMKPIGVIHTPYSDIAQTPLHPTRSPASGLVEIYPEYAAGLRDIDGFSHIMLLFVFHQSRGYDLQVTPLLDDHPRGVFATRHPCRPNPIGLSIVSLLARRGNLLEIEGVDMLDGTPLVDIKPYVPEFDARSGHQIGWYAQRSKP